MGGNSPRYEDCRHCQESFVQKEGPGRKKAYCSIACRQKAQRKRDGRSTQRARADHPLGRHIAEELQVLAASLLEVEYDGQPLEVLLRTAEEVAREVEYYVAAAVQDARSKGAGWGSVADAANVSTTTARTTWAESKVRRQLERRAADRAERRPRAAAPHAEGLSPEQGKALSQASERASAKLASALLYLHQASGLTIKCVAQHTSLSPSHVSRLLSGERTPTWSVLCTLVRLCGGDPADLRVLFENAHGLVPLTRHAVPDAAERLLAALQGLYLAAGRPEYGRVRHASHGVLTTQDIRDILEGQMVPTWEATSALVSALDAWPADIRPLWEAVHYAFLVCLDPVPHESAVPRPDGG
ncbi:helix-turn-helix domain-containing protein [Streptomyces sp. 110]|uniref:Helix-turn-helix domain-containing protein n=1 Tax=Streptomyces endocoffeicus TaxID=2898945 RepID=A0ABS1Q746_9ACTN|nr:helix-turn-helix transcriptional regulator [Streptomyces endocoffeicus]MBL1120481.1 helix-turn-helix domain-containing protein [Streptomyces endocoffeicus]